MLRFILASTLLLILFFSLVIGLARGIRYDAAYFSSMRTFVIEDAHMDIIPLESHISDITAGLDTSPLVRDYNVVDRQMQLFRVNIDWNDTRPAGMPERVVVNLSRNYAAMITVQSSIPLGEWWVILGPTRANSSNGLGVTLRYPQYGLFLRPPMSCDDIWSQEALIVYQEIDPGYLPDAPVLDVIDEHCASHWP